MGTIRKEEGRFVVVKTYCKHGKGAKGAKEAKTTSTPNDTGCQKGTGKRAEVYQKCDGEKPKLLASAIGPTYAHAVRELRKSGYIPSYVSIDKKHVTHF